MRVIWLCARLECALRAFAEFPWQEPAREYFNLSRVLFRVESAAPVIRYAERSWFAFLPQRKPAPTSFCKPPVFRRQAHSMTASCTFYGFLSSAVRFENSIKTQALGIIWALDIRVHFFNVNT